MYVTSVPVGNPNFMIAFVPRGIEKYRPPIIYILVFWIWLSNGYCSKYGWLDTSVHSTVGKIPSGFLRIVQFVLGKQDEYVSPIVPHFFSIVCLAYDTIFSVFRKNTWRCESYCLLLCTVLCVIYWLINAEFFFSLYDQTLFKLLSLQSGTQSPDFYFILCIFFSF